MMTVDAFRTRVETFLAKGGISPTRLGIVIANDPNFIRDLRSGRVPNLVLAGKVISFIEASERKGAVRQSVSAHQ